MGTLHSAAILTLFLFVPSCSGGDEPLDGAGVPAGDSGSGGFGGDAASVDDAADAVPVEEAAVPDGSGPQYVIHVVSSADTFPHTDGWSGQTANNTSQGVRSFRLFRQASDPAPVVVFDHGAGYVEAGYDAGDDTIVGSAPTPSIQPGHYTFARFGVSHSRFRVHATMHYNGAAIPGEYDCVQVLSDGTDIDGVLRNRGWYRYVFEVAGKSYPQEGDNAPLPDSASTGGFTMVTIGNQTYYEFPIDVTVPPAVGADVHTGLLVNMFESFRWEDQDFPGYTQGVYDTTPISYEPVRRFGANTASMIVLPQ